MAARPTGHQWGSIFILLLIAVSLSACHITLNPTKNAAEKEPPPAVLGHFADPENTETGGTLWALGADPASGRSPGLWVFAALFSVATLVFVLIVARRRRRPRKLAPVMAPAIFRHPPVTPTEETTVIEPPEAKKPWEEETRILTLGN
ncbi:MAG: hypothetical protein ACYTAF_08715 [Planctomycetota bacterium]|jgi:hypothetical protein